MADAVKVQILGETYSIQGDLDEAYIQKLAAYVDRKMRAIAEMAPLMEHEKMAILAALAIADELHQVKDEGGDDKEILKERAERCLNLVERALKITD